MDNLPLYATVLDDIDQKFAFSLQCTGSREKGWQINYVMKGKIDVMPACDYNFPTLQEAREAIFNCLHFPPGLLGGELFD